MPRDGSGIYTTPAGTAGVPDTTIESAKYNANVNDVAADLNAPRPIVAGGTGATYAGGARLNLKAEVAGQQVTNYDTHTWENGSFWSAGGATAAPTAGAGYVGVCTIYDVGTSFNFIAIEARNVSETPVGTLWVRQKSAGVWSSWVAQPANPSADFVNVTGDTMTGNLNINSLNSALGLNSPTFGTTNIVASITNKSRWWFRLGNGETESGANAGSNFDILRCADDGTVLGGSLSINRATGVVTNVAKAVITSGVDNGWGPLRFAALGAGTIGWDINNSGTFTGIWDAGNSPSGGTGAGAYQKFASGQVFQFGYVGVGGEVSITFPVAFPTVCQAVFATMNASGLAGDIMLSIHSDAISTAGFFAHARYMNPTSGGVATQSFYWLAIGY